MKFKSTIIVSTAVLSTSFFMVACGEKTNDQSVSAPSSTQTESQSPKAKSIAKEAASYREVVLSKSIDEAGWKSFVSDYARLAASKKDITDKELAYAAFPEVAVMADPFKREEAIQAKADQLKALRSEATPRIKLVSPSTAFLSAYDMEKEMYVVNFEGAGNEFTTSWNIENVSTSYLALKYCMEKGQGGRCAGSRSVAINVPKDRARIIEAELAKRGSRTLALALYASVKNFGYLENAPERSTIELNIEGVSLHTRNPQNEWDVNHKDTILFLDGPDLQNTTAMRS